MFDITVDTKEFTQQIMRLDSLESAVDSTAENKGFRYFWAVDRGRGPIRPVRAKALRFTVGGEVVFAKYAGPAKAQHLTERSIQELPASAISAAMEAKGTTLQNWGRSFLAAVARFEAAVLGRLSPVVTGRLAHSYRVSSKG